MDPIEYLLGLEAFGIKLGLDNITVLCRALGDPQRRYRTILVGGTNGKGSVVAMVERALRAAGHRTGRYTSPHLIRLNERFGIGGRPVDRASLIETADRVRTAIDRARCDGGLATCPTFFEATTAVAFELFRRADVTIAVLEVGLGGRFDATNIVTPRAAAITSIDYDHEQYLGRTLEEIAFEKAGIVKPGSIVVTGPLPPEASRLVARVARERGARVVEAMTGCAVEARVEHGVTLMKLATPARDYGTVRLALAGRHQVPNAAVAARLLEEIDRDGVAVSRESVVAGLEQVTWPGRLQRVEAPGGGTVLFDCAHNPAGARALADYLAEAHPDPVPIVFGVMRDKDAAGMLRALAPRAARLVLTEPRTRRAASTTALARLAAAIAPAVLVDIEPDPRRALHRALATADLTVVAGSIYLVGELLDAVAPASD